MSTHMNTYTFKTHFTIIGTCIIWLHLYDFSSIDKSIETETRLVVVRGWKRKEWAAREGEAC